MKAGGGGGGGRRDRSRSGGRLHAALREQRMTLVVVLCFEQYPYEKKVLEGSQDESTHLRKSAPLLSPKISSGALGRDGRTSSNMALGGRMTLPLHNLGFVWTRVCPAKIQKGER